MNNKPPKDNQSKIIDLSELNNTYYPIQNSKYEVRKGAFKKGLYPPLIMSETEILEHLLRKSAVCYFLQATNSSLEELAEKIEIPLEKLMTFDSFTKMDIMKLDILRNLLNEEFILKFSL